MCGIAGIASLDGRELPRRGIAREMCAQIVHRGPDDEGFHGVPGAELGMRRLAIIDLAGGHQPIGNEDGSAWIVFNGEIYNYRELRADLESRGHAFRTNSDTEAIIHAYEEWGEECFARLRGMFAVAILDLARDRLVLARDRLGKKPLYHAEIDGCLAFASELKCFLAVPGFAPRPCARAAREFFSLGYVPAPGTIYENVHKLPPAHYLVLEKGAVRTARYWRLAFGPKWTQDAPVLRRRLAGVLDEAVRVRLVSDVPFGAFLSGGLDSSVVAALMARHLSSPVKTFTIGFEDDAFNEIPDARLVARHIGAEHHELVMKPDAASLVDEIAWHCDEPFGDASSIPTLLVSRLAAGHVKMVLSGDGGDEAFAGYERYGKYMRLDRLARAGMGLAGPAVDFAGRLRGGAAGTRLRRIAARLRQRYPDRYLSGVALTTAGDVAPVLSPEVAAIEPWAGIRGHFLRDDVAHPMERVLSGDVDTYLADDVLVKVDRMTMAASLEARAPLLDHELLEFAARLPFDLKHDGTRGKLLLREVAAELLPPECLRKRKQGFGVPLAAWFRAELRPLMGDLLSSRAFVERGVCSPAGVRAAFDEHLSGRHDFSELLWLCLMYELWARAFVDGARPEPRRGAP